MDGAGLTENFQSGLFERSDGHCFVRCEFDPSQPMWIDVTSDVWSATYAGRQHQLDWGSLDLSPGFETSLRRAVLGRLKTRAPTYLRQTQGAIENLCTAASQEHIDIRNGFGGIGASEWLAMWVRLDSYSRSLIRSLYQELAEEGEAGANFAIAKELGTWKARDDVQVLRWVTEWNPTSGSFTSLEWELVRRALKAEIPDEGDADCAARVFGRILDETLKRPLQVLTMRRDALWTSPSGREFFLRVPKVKVQAGDRPTSWQITENLAKAILAYSERPRIHALQERFDRLVVMPLTSGREAKWMHHGQVDVATAKMSLQTWAEHQGMVSPRTHGRIHLTPYRIRHTGATTLALQGAPRDQIQEILEHDSPASADAYIQAVGSDLMPALERSTGRGVGEVFSELRRAYFFKGTVTDQVHERPVHIPDLGKGVATPAVVGSCGKNSACTEHPFWACYDGCPHFLAWRDGPHERSLEYVESELERWGRAEGGKERSKLGKDFDRVGAAIREVIGQVEQSKATDTRNERD